MNDHLANLSRRAQTLVEALPYLRRYAGATMVIKYGGAAMVDSDLKAEVLKDVVLLRYVGMNPVLVHGGGPEISSTMERLGKKPEFVGGLRVTDQETMEIVEMVLVGRTNRDLVTALNLQGGQAIGLSGKDANLLVAEKRTSGGQDLGLVGDVVQVNPEILHTLIGQGYIPVVAPVSAGKQGESLNVNADQAASCLASALQAAKLVVLSDVPGVLADRSQPESLVSALSPDQARQMIADGRIESGMIPKVEACLSALEGGVLRCHLIDGRLPHALLMEIFTDAGIGTMIETGKG